MWVVYSGILSCTVYRVQITVPHIPSPHSYIIYTIYILYKCVWWVYVWVTYIYINRVWRVVLVVYSSNLYFSLSASIVFLRSGKRDKVLTALLVLRYTSSSVAVQEQTMRWGGCLLVAVGRFCYCHRSYRPFVCLSVRWWRCVFKYH